LRLLKVLLLLRLSLSCQPRKHLYAANIGVVTVIFLGIEGLNALIVLIFNFLYIIYYVA
jgi:hypothetical protein